MPQRYIYIYFVFILYIYFLIFNLNKKKRKRKFLYFFFFFLFSLFLPPVRRDPHPFSSPSRSQQPPPYPFSSPSRSQQPPPHPFSSPSRSQQQPPTIPLFSFRRSPATAAPILLSGRFLLFFGSKTAAVTVGRRVTSAQRRVTLCPVPPRNICLRRSQASRRPFLSFLLCFQPAAADSFSSVVCNAARLSVRLYTVSPSHVVSSQSYCSTSSANNICREPN